MGKKIRFVADDELPPPEQKQIRFVPDDESGKKKDDTLSVPVTTGSVSATAGSQPVTPSQENGQGQSLDQKLNRLSKVAQMEYESWADRRGNELSEVIKKDPQQYDSIVKQFDNENQAKVTELNETFGRFAGMAKDREPKPMVVPYVSMPGAGIPIPREITNPVVSVITDMIPKAWAAQDLTITPFADKIKSKAELASKGTSPLQDIDRRRAEKIEKSSWSKEDQAQYELDVENAYKNFVGEEQFNQEKEAHRSEQVQKSLSAWKEMKIQDRDRMLKMAGIPQTWAEANGITGVIQYGVSSIAETAGQIIPSAFTLGGSSYAFERADILDEGISAKAKLLGITPEELIQKGDFKDVEELASEFGAINAALDVVSLGTGIGTLAKKTIGVKLLDAMVRKPGLKAMVQGLKSVPGKAGIVGVTEAFTEGVQEMNTIASSKIAGGEAKDYVGAIESFGDEDWDRVQEASIKGGIGGGFLGGLGSAAIRKPAEVIKEQTNGLDTKNVKAIENAAEVIQKNFEANEQKETGPATAAVPETKAEETLPVQEQEVKPTEETKTIEQLQLLEKEAKDNGDETMSSNYVEVLSKDDFKSQYSEYFFNKKFYDLNEAEKYEVEMHADEKFKGEGYYNEEMDDYVGNYENALRGFWDSPIKKETLNQPENGNIQQSEPRQVTTTGQENQAQEEKVSAIAPETGRPEVESIDQRDGVVEPSPPETKKTALGKRIEENETVEQITERVKKADDYVVRKIDLTDKEAKDLLKEWNDNEHAEKVIRDQTIDLNPGVRATLAANLYQEYKGLAEQSTNQQEKTQLHEKAADIGIWAAQNLTKAGQETAIAGKIWKSILQDEDVAIIALEQQNKQVAKSLIKPIQAEVQQSKTEFNEEVRRIIEQRVTEGVEKRLERAKLITKEKKKEISDFFDSLLIDTKSSKGITPSVIVPPFVIKLGAEVYNGSIKTIKQAVLTGADLTNAIQAGIDYIKANYKGTEFNEDEYRNSITPQIQRVVDRVEARDINEANVKTPGIKGKNKKEFIENVVEAQNEGKLTDEKFEELYAKQIGYKPYSETDRAQIRELSKIISETEKFKESGREEWNKISEELKGEGNDKVKQEQARKKFEQLIEKNKDLINKAQIANKKMQEFARAPHDVYDTLITIIQGNLLTPLSLVTNVYSNALLQPLRFTSTAIGSGIDIATSELAKLGILGKSYKDRTIDLMSLGQGYFPGGWNGLMEGIAQLKTGSLVEDKNLREIQGGFDPQRAISRWADADRTTKQKVNDYIEGTFGIPAEVMFRLLNLGDKPFKRAAEMAKAHEIGTMKGLKGNDLLGFIVFPDEQSKIEIVKAGQEATFQQETKLSQGIQRGVSWVLNAVNGIPIIGGVAKVILKSQIPYVKTPLNIVIETIDYAVPPATLARGIYAYSKGNKREGNVLIGKAIVGSMIMAAAQQLFVLGLMEPDEDDKEKSAKRKEARNLRFETVPPNSINTSALMRGLLGQGFEKKDGDVNVSFDKMGVMGVLLDVHATNMYKDLKEKGKVDTGVNALFLDMFTSMPRVASSALDMSFLRGTNSLLTAIQDGGGYETEQWLINSMGSLTSIVLPNTISSFSKASDEYVRDTYDKDFGERLKATYLNKVFLGNLTPPKINLWGEKITGAPEGRTKFFYYLFDVTKFKETSDNDFKYELYKKWKADAYNDDWLPSMPDRNITIRGRRIPLTPTQYRLLCEEVGRYRYRLCSSSIRSKFIKVEDLKEKYSDGARYGRELFLLKSGMKAFSNAKLDELAAK